MWGGQLQTAALIVTGGSVAFAVAVTLWAYRLTDGVRAAQAKWRARAEDLERRVDRSDAIFAAHPGVIVVWEEEPEAPEGESADIGPESPLGMRRVEFKDDLDDERGSDFGDDLGDGAEDDPDDDVLELTEAVGGGPVALRPDSDPLFPNSPSADWGEPRLFGSPPALAAILRFADASDGPNAGARILDGLADYEADDVTGAKTTLRERLNALRENGEAFTIVIHTPQGRRVDADGRPAGRRAVLWLADSTVKTIEVSQTAGALPGPKETGPDPYAMVDLLSKAPFPMFRLSRGLKLQWANPPYLKIVGARSVEDAVNRDLQLDDQAKEHAKRAQQHGARTDETRRIAVDGEVRHFAISIFPISGGLAGMAIDITREQKALVALERHARAQDEALNHFRDAVAIFGPDQKLVFYNRAFKLLFKLEESWLRQRPSHGKILDTLRDRRLIPEQSDYKAWRAAELSRYGDAKDDTPEDVWHLPDNRMLRVARLGQPLGGLLLIFDDMTREVSLETEYNTLIKVQRLTLDKLNEGVAVFGSDGKLKLRNAAFETIWAIPPGKLGKNASFDDVVELCLPLFAKRDVWAEIKARVTDVNPDARRPIVREIRRSDGTILSYLQRPLPDGSTVLAFHDVTAARKLEAALKDRTEALEAADLMKSHFVENVSYHLRAPLTSVIGFSELLNTTILGKLSESEASHLGAIIQAAQDLNKLVEDIIDVAAIEAKTLELDISDMDVRVGLESAINLVKTRAEQTRLHLTLACARDVGVARADQRRIKQAVYNLLLNALTHTKPGGSIEVGADRDGATVRIWVEDDGEGIPLEKQGRVFDAFQHGDRGGGAGLGLTLVREIVELHGGMVEIESEPDVGTRVTCRLPVNPPGDPASSPSKPKSTGAT